MSSVPDKSVISSIHTLQAFCSMCICVYLQVLTHACMRARPSKLSHACTNAAETLMFLTHIPFHDIMVQWQQEMWHIYETRITKLNCELFIHPKSDLATFTYNKRHICCGKICCICFLWEESLLMTCFPAEMEGFTSMLFYAQKYCGRPVKFSCRRPVPRFSFRSVINIDNKGSARLIYFGLAGKREGKTTRRVFLCHQLIRQTLDIVEKAAKIA